MAVALRVYDSDLTTLLATLDQPYAIAWSRERLDSGAGQFTIPHDSPVVQSNPDVLGAERLVVVNVDGQDEFGWLIRRKQRVRGDVWDPISVTGPGMIEVLRQALVYQRGGLNSLVQSDVRLFGWMAYDFPDENWGPVGSNQTGGPLSTEGFPDSRAVAFEPIFPGGRALYRRRMLSSEDQSLAGPARMHLAATISTEVVVYIDGEEVMRKEAGEQGLVIADVPYEVFDHQLAVEVTGGTGRWGWSWVQLVEGDDGELTYGSVIRRTYDPAEFPDADSDWLSYEVVDVDSPYPGVTPGFILRTLVDEYQDRGGLAAISVDFDANVDSSGAPWPRVGGWAGAPGRLEFACQVGDDSILGVIERLRDHGVDAELGPDLVLRAWQGRGVDRGGDASAPVVFGLGMAHEVQTETEDEILNVLLARTAEAWIERPSPRVTTNRREGFLSLGLTPSDTGGARVADEVLFGFASSVQAVRFTVDQAQGPPTPTVDFDLGDRVVGPFVDPSNIAGEWGYGDLRVDSIAAVVGLTGEVAWVIETSGGRASSYSEE